MDPFKKQNQIKSFLIRCYSLWNRSVDSHARQIFNFLHSLHSLQQSEFAYSVFAMCRAPDIHLPKSSNDFFFFPPWWKCFSSSKCNSIMLTQRPVMPLLPQTALERKREINTCCQPHRRRWMAGTHYPLCMHFPHRSSCKSYKLAAQAARHIPTEEPVPYLFLK